MIMFVAYAVSSLWQGYSYAMMCGSTLLGRGTKEGEVNVEVGIRISHVTTCIEAIGFKDLLFTGCSCAAMAQPQIRLFLDLDSVHPKP